MEKSKPDGGEQEEFAEKTRQRFADVIDLGVYIFFCVYPPSVGVINDPESAGCCVVACALSVSGDWKTSSPRFVRWKKRRTSGLG